jgi:hypothetical protein
MTGTAFLLDLLLTTRCLALNFCGLGFVDITLLYLCIKCVAILVRIENVGML